MSSGTNYEPMAGRDLSAMVGSRMGLDDGSRLGKLGLSPRQRELNHLWCYYTTHQYSARRFDWDGREHKDGLEREALASATYIPPGMYDAGGQMVPIKFRRPSAPFHIVRVIVDRFTGLLFSEKRHPKLSVEYDEVAEDVANNIAEVGRLWPAMMAARTFGGAMGSSVISFRFQDGKPIFEVHDPRWVIPHFADRANLKLSAIEKRYVYPVEVRDDEGVWHEVGMWYRRVITDEVDVIYKPEPVRDGEEPQWRVDKQVDHKFGFCPAVWIQNIPVIGDVDGDPDCQGVYEMVEAVDSLYACAQSAIIANCDPTVVITTDANLPELRKGSENAIKLPSGSSATYMEIGGSGPTAAMSLAKEYEVMILKVAQVYLEGDASVPQTATEIERRYSSMLAKADILREQYGERGVKPLMAMVMEAARKFTQPATEKDAGGNAKIVRRKLSLPPRVLKENGTLREVERTVGPKAVHLALSWPRYFEPGLQDATQAVQAAAGAKTGGLIDDEHAAKFVAEYFKIEDVGKMMDAIKAEAQKKQAELEQMAMGGGFGG